MSHFYSVVFLVLSVLGVHAQPRQMLHPCAQSRLDQFAASGARLMAGDSRADEYDVQYVHLDLALDNLSTRLSGVATTKAQVITPLMTDYVFELTGELTIDSLTINGIQQQVATSGYQRSVTLAEALTQGSLFTVRVYYQGTPTYGPGFFTTGIRNEVSKEWGAQATYTLSEPYGARDWWPCKQSLKDKIDSSDVWLTVPAHLKGGSNGVLEAVVPLSDSFSRYQWKSRNPIDYYLIALAVSTYTDYSFYMHFDQSSDSMLIQNYIYDLPEVLPFYKTNIDSTALMMRYFSELFGRYPYWKEKYGHCLVPLGGGMEHQTMTTLGGFESGLVAHELGHQWFGDHVTCGTWSDIWLNEGFATYTEFLFLNRFQGEAAASNKMQAIHRDVLAQPGGSVYCRDTAVVQRIFDGRLTYSKGAAILHSLRFVFNNDSLFFQMLRGYLNSFAQATATTEEFKIFAANSLNRNLDTFINQWIYGEGFPIYNVLWNQIGDQVIVRLEQSTSAPASVNLFSTPLTIKLYGSDRDTVVRVENNKALQTFAFTWTNSVKNLEIDPEHYILSRTDSLRRDYALLSAQGLDTTLFLVYPNPSDNFWMIDGMPADCSLSLKDVLGRTLWEGENRNSNSIKIYGNKWAKGQYLLHIYRKGVTDHTIKLVKAK